MIPFSLRVRLIATWAIFIAIALQIAGIGLRLLFERSITRRTEIELRADLRQLRRGMEIATDGRINILRPPTDPQFDIAFGGRYWQISENENVLVRSASLKGETLDVSRSLVSTESPQARSWLIGPAKQKLIAIVEDVRAPDPAGKGERTFRFATAVEASEINEDTDKFTSDLFTALLGLAGLLIAGAWAQVSIGLKPLEKLRASVADVRKGTASTIEGPFPDEVMPLVTETNELLNLQKSALRVARARAGDLAHGLKTPLAVMAAKSRQLKRKGDDLISKEIDMQIDVMHRHVERELARARARGAVRTAIPPIDLAALLEALISVVQSLPRGQGLDWDCEIPSELLAAVDADDFNNMAGNLIENAQKWAKSRVRVTARFETTSLPHGLTLTVEDDGPGIDADDFERVLKRGERADTSVAGSGLGLAIVSDLVDLYKGSLDLSRSDLGGLKVVLTI